jgi:hypothetical protein
MSELRVPTHSLAAEVLCADGRTFRGHVFVPVASSQHSGPMRASEWMNDRMPFFPFLPDDGGGSFILNRSEVLVLTLSAVDDAGDDDEIAQAAIRRRVVVELRDRRFEGEIVIEMPENLRRVADFLNRPDPFLIVEDGDRRHLIRKARITRVIEPRG